MRKPTILLIEDDKDILTILRDQLVMDDFKVLEATSGEEGTRLFKQFRPDLIILDLNLPDIDGVKICQNLRRISDVPIIILTARESLADKVRGLNCGADDYIVKPFEYLELAARIRVCLRRSSSKVCGKEKCCFGELEILLNTREVLLQGKAVHLTKKEFDLLELLVSYAGEVLSRDFICSQIWPNDEVYSWSRALDVHIRRLRKKIEPDPQNPKFIITHPGVGYRFAGN
ncbi:response regulator transcription factor [Desulfohalobiaceae bacterium Ax17]|uniref:response regulator transcription factor n=1 Tax=Desulfovulcanus ferrireducens TaxID=2831190 RepID=UPI00207BCF90|nr:response regulator transcription factor [Desulfovulcanus ferrireducens]MBT8764512.1 response regulator transcription factor [Desulfovulcanus ferrireducens]